MIRNVYDSNRCKFTRHSLISTRDFNYPRCIREESRLKRKSEMNRTERWRLSFTFPLRENPPGGKLNLEQTFHYGNGRDSRRTRQSHDAYTRIIS